MRQKKRRLKSKSKREKSFFPKWMTKRLVFGFSITALILSVIWLIAVGVITELTIQPIVNYIVNMIHYTSNKIAIYFGFPQPFPLTIISNMTAINVTANSISANVIHIGRNFCIKTDNYPVQNLIIETCNQSQK